jgi:hypothetical protein
MHVQFDRSHGNGRRIYCRILQAGEAIALAGQASAAGMAGILTGGCGIKLSGFHQWRKICYTVSGSPQRELYIDIEVQSESGQICRVRGLSSSVQQTQNLLSPPPDYSPRISPQASDSRPTLRSHPSAMNDTASQDRQYIATTSHEEGK